jgi:hypothetical protein
MSRTVCSLSAVAYPRAACTALLAPTEEVARTLERIGARRERAERATMVYFFWKERMLSCRPCRPVLFVEVMQQLF